MPRLYQELAEHRYDGNAAEITTDTIPGPRKSRSLVTRGDLPIPAPGAGRPRQYGEAPIRATPSLPTKPSDWIAGD